MILSRESPAAQTERPRDAGPRATAPDCLHPAIAFHYWPFRANSLELIEAKGRRFIIRRLQRMKKTIGLEGVSANFTTSAKMSKLA
jgi:hypothetical protein